jgi:hypothetical protein
MRVFKSVVFVGGIGQVLGTGPQILASSKLINYQAISQEVR